MGIIRRYIFLLGLLGITLSATAQEPVLPIDLRQHNLTEYNSSLFSPVFSLDRNQPQSLALWTRWQWQMVDGDPTTMFLNYTRKINPSMAGGLGVFQQNTGVFLNRGGVLNYAFTTEIVPGFDFAAGFNLFGYQRQLADDRFNVNSIINLPELEETDDFIVQLAPSIQFSYGEFSLGMVVENLIEYNLSTSENQISNNGNVFIGILGYRIPVNLSEELGPSMIQPTLYVKRLPDFENQVGITTLFSTPKFWVQGGYNSFYGVSGGIGGRFFKNFSIGALIEYGIQGDLKDQDPSFELVTSYSFGPQTFGVKNDVELKMQEENAKEIGLIEEAKEQGEAIDKQLTDDATPTKSGKQRRLDRRKEKDSLRIVQKEQEEQLARVLMQRKQDSINAAREKAQEADIQRRNDSIMAAKEEAQALATRRRQDSIRVLEEARKADAIEQAAQKTKIKQEQTQVTPRKGEKYEEAVNEEGLEAGYYLIANVFRTKRYYEAFMGSLKDRGLNPKSFYRASRNYNYVYLGKYNTIAEARQARDNQLKGQYTDNLWIFRAVARE
ncbi:PorP/SprF family type IX secretion system membrane protein [Flavobacteriaceae bacterium D16]|nr:PorP/SprF family type IX secretion system membrane protein [Flavobacteriaceae bacterium D16]